MDLRFTPEQDAFRKEARAWLEAHVPREQLSRMNCQMFSTGFNSGDRGGSITMEMLSGTVSLAVVCHPA